MPKNINVYTITGDSYATQIWEYYYSYKQYVTYPNSPKININFDVLDNVSLADKTHVSILHISISDTDVLLKIKEMNFDLIFVDNMFEHLMVCNTDMLEYIKSNDNVYFIVGSFVHEEHELFDKCITMSEDWSNCRSWYTNAKVFTSFAYDLHTPKTDDMAYVGGALKSWRKYIIDNLRNCVDIDIIQNSDVVRCTNDAILSDSSGQEFIVSCNARYGVTGVIPPPSEFHESIYYGIPSRPAGEAAMSLWPLLEYKTHKCILYAESSLINGEIFPTEKTWKCVVSKTHWILFAGSNAYSLLKRMGIRSILELVPGGIAFDAIHDHKERYREQIKSIKYLNSHSDIFNSCEAMDILNSNYQEFLTGNEFMMPLVNKLDNILELT